MILPKCVTICCMLVEFHGEGTQSFRSTFKVSNRFSVLCFFVIKVLVY